MKHIKIKNGKLYISKNLLIFGAGVFGLLLIVAVGMYSTSNSADSKARPLGIAPKGASSVPKDSEAAARFMIQKIKEEHLNKLTIIFYYDSYDKEDDAVGDAKLLMNALTNTEPYKELKDIIVTKIITSGQICNDEGEKLFCDPKHIEALQKLGIEHVKIIVLYPGVFKPSVDFSFGADSVVGIPTLDKKNLPAAFIKLLGESLGASEKEGRGDQYLKGALSCFYGNKESYSTGLLTYKSCGDFKAKYPKFWEHDVK